MFLFIIVVACVGLIANRQWELNAAKQEKDDCINKVINLKYEIGRLKQLEELETCQVELVKKLTEVKGKCLVHEENIREANSKAVVKKADDLIALLSKRDDKDAKRMDVCVERLREAEIEARQLIKQIATLVQQKEQLNSTYKSCAEQLGAYNLKKTD